MPLPGITANLKEEEMEKVVFDFTIMMYQNMVEQVTAMLESAVTETERLTRSTEKSVAENYALQNIDSTHEALSLENTLALIANDGSARGDEYAGVVLALSDALGPQGRLDPE